MYTVGSAQRQDTAAYAVCQQLVILSRCLYTAKQQKNRQKHNVYRRTTHKLNENLINFEDLVVKQLLKNHLLKYLDTKSKITWPLYNKISDPGIECAEKKQRIKICKT